MNFQGPGSRDSNVLIASAVNYKFLLEESETSRAKHQQPRNFLNKFVMSLLSILKIDFCSNCNKSSLFMMLLLKRSSLKNEESNCATDELFVLFCYLQLKSASCVLIIATILKMSTH